MQETRSDWHNFFRYELLLKDNFSNHQTSLRFSEDFTTYDDCFNASAKEASEMNGQIADSQNKAGLEYIFKIHSYYRQVRK